MGENLGEGGFAFVFRDYFSLYASDTRYLQYHILEDSATFLNMKGGCVAPKNNGVCNKK